MKNIQSILEKYLRQRPLFLSLIRAKEAALLADYLPLNGPVLDVGCGDGFFASVAFRSTTGSFIRSNSKKKRIQDDHTIDVGLDLPGSRMDQAKALGIYKELMTFDGTNIPLKEKSMSTAVSNCVLEHVADLPGLLRNIARVLKPKGMFLATVAAKPWEENLLGSMFLGTSYQGYMRRKQVHLNLLTGEQWNAVFEKAGFVVEKRVGYLTPKACRLVDASHYVSIPSLISYMLFGRWVLFPGLQLYPTAWLSRVMSQNCPVDTSGALLYVLRKNSGGR